jgi:hypothetical protein
MDKGMSSLLPRTCQITLRKDHEYRFEFITQSLWRGLRSIEAISLIKCVFVKSVVFVLSSLRFY